MLFYLEQGAALYCVGLVLLLGLISKWIANHTYKRLLVQTEDFSSVKNANLKQIRSQYETVCRANGQVQNVPVMIEKQFGQIRVLGMRLYRMENLALPLALLCFLIGTGSSFAAFLNQGTVNLIVTQFAAGLLSGIVLVAMECSCDLGSKRSLLFVQIQDYLENSLRIPSKSAAAASEGDSVGKKSMKDDIFMKPKTEQAYGRRTEGENAGADQEYRRRLEGGSFRRDYSRDAAVQETGYASEQQNARETFSRFGASQEQSSDYRGGFQMESGRRSQGMEEQKIESGRLHRSEGGQALGTEGSEDYSKSQAAMYRERDKDITFLRKSLEQIAAAKEQKGQAAESAKKLSPEEERLMEEIIKEYLSQS